MTGALRLPGWARHVLAGSALLGSLAFAQPADAYRTASALAEFAGTEQVRWELPVIAYVLHPDLPPELEGMNLETVLGASFRAWSAPACSGLTFVSLGVASDGALAEDGLNTVQWLSSGWSELGAPPDAAALTDVQYQKGPNGKWAIVEADLYLNAEDHEWSLDGRIGVRAVVTHEAGHMLGLLHPCELDGEAGAPDCYDLPSAADATMFPAYSADEETLAPDDEEGLCFLYPKGDEPGAGVGATGRPASFGSTCSEAADCADGQCLAGLTDEPVCTRTCDAALEGNCPSGWRCSSVQDRDVCAPEPALVATGGSSCQLSHVSPVPTAPVLFVLSIVFTAAVRRRRGRVLD